ncbi:MAG: AAA family ATPase [Polyangiaceae bacterium]|jgi:predicted ATPase|nr:AAA family ATPase [Polyangiaceae bacterium]
MRVALQGVERVESPQRLAMATKLTQIAAAGFKSIASLSLELRDLNVLIGANGAGKSNFVGLFAMLSQLADKRLQLFVATSGGPDALLTNGVKHTDTLSVALRFDQQGYSFELVPTADDKLVFASEACRWFGPNPAPYHLELGAGHAEALLHKAHAPRPLAPLTLEAMKGWGVYHFHDTSREAKVKQLGPVDDNATLRPDAANLAAFLLLLEQKHPAQYRLVVETVRLAAPFFDDFRLRPSPANEEKIRLEWRAKHTDAYFNAHALSDGTLRFICLATLLLQPTLPSLLLIDEPELGLHPYAINLLAGLLKAAATCTQVVVSTQSVTLVDQFEPGDLVVVDRNGDGSAFRRLAPDELAGWLDDYSLGELWEKNVFGGRPR